MTVMGIRIHNSIYHIQNHQSLHSIPSLLCQFERPTRPIETGYRSADRLGVSIVFQSISSCRWTCDSGIPRNLNVTISCQPIRPLPFIHQFPILVILDLRPSPIAPL